MNNFCFIWDENKNATNIRKHGIDFREAATVFLDDYAVLFDDPDHSQDEERFLIIGYSAKQRVCIVSHCYREDDSKIRIISARKAHKDEIRDYKDYMEDNGYER
jgi:uncharacterized DUF497 family protein